MGDGAGAYARTRSAKTRRGTPMAVGELRAPDVTPPVPGLRTRRGRPLGRPLVLVLGAALIAVFYLLPAAGLGQALVLIAVAGAAVAATLRAGRRAAGSARTCWLALAPALGLPAVTDASRSLAGALRHQPLAVPSWTDASFVLAVPCFAVAIGAVVLARRGADPIGDLLDAL